MYHTARGFFLPAHRLKVTVGSVYPTLVEFHHKEISEHQNFQLRDGIHSFLVHWRVYPTCFYFYVYRMSIVVMVRSHESEGVVQYRDDMSIADAPPWGFIQVVAVQPQVPNFM